MVQQGLCGALHVVSLSCFVGFVPSFPPWSSVCMSARGRSRAAILFLHNSLRRRSFGVAACCRVGFTVGFLIEKRSPCLRSRDDSYLVDPASSHMLVSKIKPCMSKYKLLYTVKLRMAH